MEVIGKKPILGNPADLMEEEVGEILCHTIRIGEYVVTKPNEGMPIPVSFSNTGFYFSLPDSKNSEDIKEIKIPARTIIMLKALLEASLQIILIIIGPNQAKTMRHALSLDDKDEKGNNVFCPLQGNLNQRFIIFCSHSEVAPLHVDMMKQMFSAVCIEINRSEAAEALLLATSEYEQNHIIRSTATPLSQPESTNEGANTELNSDELLAKLSQKQLKILQDPPNVLAFEDKNGVKGYLNFNDILRLKYPCFINDNIIYFWFNYIINERAPEDSRSRIFVYDTYFYSTLRQAMEGKKNQYHQVQRRTKKVDIFTKEMLVIPINERNHWCLAVICFPGLNCTHKRMPMDTSTDQTSQMSFSAHQKKATVKNSTLIKGSTCQLKELPKSRIVVLDSYPICIDHKQIINTLRSYIRMEFSKTKKSNCDFNVNTLPGIVPPVPLQPNPSDCGVFMLKNLEQIFFDVAYFHQNCIDLRHWYVSRDISLHKRKEMYDTILKKGYQQSPDKLLDLYPKLTFEMDEENLTVEDSHPEELMIY